MPLEPGSKLGPYQILAPAGAANGSEIYKATDTRLNREVAIKVSASGFSESFEREARAVASLNHPNICALHDIGHEDGVDFLVMEHLEGQTLAERLKGKPLGLNEAMNIALAIADALDKAHGQGVAHRGLNPSKVMLTKGGVKLLDFGLAPDEGVSSYTAPEQLEAKGAAAPSDARSDIFAFGAILYEMVTGKKAFEGKSRAVLIAAIATAEPDPFSPPALQHIVLRCLAKDPEDRWQTAHDLLIQLRWFAEGDAHPGSAPAGSREKLARILLAAAVLLIAGLAYPAVLYLRGPADPGSFQLRVPVRGLSAADTALSPDGRIIALAARPNTGESSSLYVRRVGAVPFQKLGGTDDAAQPFFSADSRFIAFAAGGRLKKVSVSGGAPQDIGEAQGFSGGAWSRDGIILFGSAKGVYRISAEGGTPAAVTTVDPQESGHLWPSFLPDGRHFLYLAWSGQAANRAVFLGQLGSKDKTRLIAAESNAAYAAPGYVVFHRQASLFAQPFDAKKLVLSGEPVHVADDVSSNTSGRGDFDVSQNGVLLYFQGGSATSGRAQASFPNALYGWVDRSGSISAAAGTPAAYGDFDVSPDGKLVAVTRQEPGSPGADIWVIDWQRAGASFRLTLDPGDNINPVWSPDGKRIAYTSYRKGNADIYVKNANGVGPEAPLAESANDEIVKDWSKDDRYIAYLSGQDDFHDIYALPLTDGKPSNDKKPFPLVQGHFHKDEPQFSYDGKWLAYTTDESGAFQVWVMAFPGGDPKLQVSVNGGGQPRWRRDGKELYYRAPDNTIMEVDIQAGARLEASAPRMLFRPPRGNVMTIDPIRHQLSIAPDGQRFMLMVPANATAVGNTSPGSAPQVPNTINAGAAVAGGANGAATPGSGLTVIQHWTAALGKADK